MATEDFVNRQVAVVSATTNRREEQCRWNNSETVASDARSDFETKAAHRQTQPAHG